MKKLAHILKKVPAVPQSRATPEENRHGSRFLQLPGEIRNMVYDYAMYPKLRSLTLACGPRREYFARTVLHPGLLRTSHQIRAEVLSHLVSSKRLNIFGIETACAFFDYIGNALAKVTRITITQPLGIGEAIPQEHVTLFLKLLPCATSLKYLKLQLGFVEGLTKEQVPDADWVFLEQMVQFAQENPSVQFRWSSGSYSSRAQNSGTNAQRTRFIRDVLGEDKEERGTNTVMLW